MYYSPFADKLLAENRELKRKITLYESEDALANVKAQCDRRVRAASEREKMNHDAWMNALAVNRELKERNKNLWRENKKLQKIANHLERKNQEQECQTGRLRVEKDSLLEQNCSLSEQIALLRAEGEEKDGMIEALKEEVCKLRARLDHDGTTNGIPTSQTPADKKKVIPNTREKSGREKGGQPGHRKHTMEAFETEEITDVEAHTLEACPECGGELEVLEGEVVKDEADYEVRIIKKRHMFPQYRCKNCGKIVRERIPGNLKEQNQYGASLQAMILALLDLGFVSVGRTQEIVSGILQRKITPSEGYVGKVQKKASKLLRSFVGEVKAFCLEQRILHWDDTVIFINGSRACFRFYGNEKVAYYTAHEKKDAKGIEADGILSSLTETTYLMHDHIRYNYRDEFLFQNIECIQHMERELERVFRDSGHEWAEAMKKLIQEMIHKRKEHIKKGEKGFDTKETDAFETQLEEILKRGHMEYAAEKTRYYSNDEKNALKKLEEYKDNYFAWIYDFTLPTTNNLAESGLRMTKTKQKVSGQFLKEETAGEFAAVRTYTETCRRNGINEYKALERLMSGNPYTMKEILISSC